MKQENGTKANAERSEDSRIQTLESLRASRDLAKRKQLYEVQTRLNEKTSLFLTFIYEETHNISSKKTAREIEEEGDLRAAYCSNLKKDIENLTELLTLLNKEDKSPAMPKPEKKRKRSYQIINNRLMTLSQSYVMNRSQLIIMHLSNHYSTLSSTRPMQAINSRWI